MAEATGVSEQEAKDWLLRQPIYQIYLPRPKHIFRPNASFSEVLSLNEIHQADLLHMPLDKSYIYALTIVDVATRYKTAIPLKSKKTIEVMKGFKKVYNETPLKPPKSINLD
ncbi:transposase family protein, partial [Acinetobacter baumannii]|uniref:transposase family protein n=1 Tax=Acinetobacter baumannii TaxID=470 RepID=UPI0011781272